MLYKYESFFCFFAILFPIFSPLWGDDFHVSDRISVSLAPPYVFSFLSCIWVGAPAYTFSQGHACSQHVARRLGTHTRSQGCGRGQHDAWRPEMAAGASFVAGAAGVLQEGAALPSPHPSFQKRQGKTSWSAVWWLSGCGSFLGHWSRVGIPAPRVRGILGFCFLGIWDRSGGAKLMVCIALRSLEVFAFVGVRHG